MPWRHKDSQISDKFPENYFVRDARKIANKTIILRTPPSRILYEYGLTNLFRIMGHRLIIKNAEGHGNDPSCTISILSTLSALFLIWVSSLQS